MDPVSWLQSCSPGFARRVSLPFAMQKRPSQPWQWAVATRFALIPIGLALACCGDSAIQEPRADKQPVVISVEEIHAMFAENQIGGAQFFETRKAVLTGEVVRVREALG